MFFAEAKKNQMNIFFFAEVMKKIHSFLNHFLLHLFFCKKRDHNLFMKKKEGFCDGNHLFFFQVSLMLFKKQRHPMQINKKM